MADTVVVTQLDAGYKHNVIPGSATAALDCRLLPDTDLDQFRAYIDRKTKKHSVRAVEISRHGGPVSTRGPTFHIIEEVSGRLPEAPLCVPSLTPGITDIRYLRAKGAQGYGWVPLILTPEELSTVHGHDERVSVEGLEQATRAMTEVVHRAATEG